MQTLEDSVRAGEQGALFAAMNADKKVSGSWTQRAAELFVDYARDVAKGQPFLTEDARAWAEQSGLPPPPDGRAWGFIAKAMRENGHVIFSGYAPAKTSNGSPKCLWRYW